jgi:hypothetical protein
MDIDETKILLQSDKYFDEKIYNIIKTLSEDTSIQKALEEKDEEHIFDGSTYFFNYIGNYNPKNFTPTKLDIIFCRKKTNGLHQLDFTYKNSLFNYSDVLGSLGMRKIWTNCVKG